MRTFLIVAGAAWFILAWVLLLSLARAARRRMPLPPPLPRPPSARSIFPPAATEAEAPPAETATPRAVGAE